MVVVVVVVIVVELVVEVAVLYSYNKSSEMH